MLFCFVCISVPGLPDSLYKGISLFSYFYSKSEDPYLFVFALIYGENHVDAPINSSPL